jgi:hypothetical protein
VIAIGRIFALMPTMCVALLATALAQPIAASSTPQPQTTASLAPSLAPDRLGAHAALTFRIHYAGGEFGVPLPVRQSVLQMPAGLSLDLPILRSCSATRLLARGPGACPAQSRLGGGHALVAVHLASETITENATMSVFLGPPHNLQPTFEILAQGYTPIDERRILTGTVRPASPPYGEELVMQIPPIPTLALEPDASISDFSLTIGARTSNSTRNDANSVVIPSSCPAGGFPFAATFTYADGSSGSSRATVPCPR